METKTIRLLTIGNSFAENATRYLGQIANAADCELVYTGANLPGGPLSIHWDGVVAHEKNPLEGRLYNDRSLTELLTTEPWDIVTLQQFSWQSHDVESYRPYAENLHALVREQAPSARILLHQTWAYRADDTERITPEYSQDAMHADIRQAYQTIAKELNMGIIPVGDAFARARHHPEWNFAPDLDFDPATAIYPERPADRHSPRRRSRRRGSLSATDCTQDRLFNTDSPLIKPAKMLFKHLEELGGVAADHAVWITIPRRIVEICRRAGFTQNGRHRPF